MFTAKKDNHQWSQKRNRLLNDYLRNEVPSVHVVKSTPHFPSGSLSRISSYLYTAKNLKKIWEKFPTKQKGVPYIEVGQVTLRFTILSTYIDLRKIFYHHQRDVIEGNLMAKCPKCGMEVSTPRKTWKMAGRPDKSGKRTELTIGLFDCCGTFRSVLSKRKI